MVEKLKTILAGAGGIVIVLIGIPIFLFSIAIPFLIAWWLFTVIT